MKIRISVSAFIALLLIFLVTGTASAKTANFDAGDPNEYNMLPVDVVIGEPDVTVQYGPHNLQALDVYIGTTGQSLIWFHGGGWEEGDKSLDVMSTFNRIPRALHNAGWTVISVNYRLSPEFHLEDMMVDFDSALTKVHVNASVWNIRPDKVVVGGFSAGGHLAGLGATAMNNESFDISGYIPKIQGIVSQDGNMMSSLYHDGLPGIERMLDCTLCSQERIAQSDIASYSDSNDPPMYLIGGSHSIIPLDVQIQTRDMVRARGQVVVFDAVDSGPEALRLHDVQGMNWSALQVFLSGPAETPMQPASRLTYQS